MTSGDQEIGNGASCRTVNAETVTEVDRVRERYSRRDVETAASQYHPTQPHIVMASQGLERALVRWIDRCAIAPVRSRTVLEIGCGDGDNLLQFLRLGFRPENLVGNELIPLRATSARHRLPDALRIVTGDAADLTEFNEKFDIVLQATVFTSLLDENFQERLADTMWSMARPGGGILWYDFIYDNPGNKDVVGIPVRRIRQLFPQGNLTTWRITLAPPIARRAARIHPGVYSLLNSCVFLRTHVLCWIQKPS